VLILHNRVLGSYVEKRVLPLVIHDNHVGFFKLIKGLSSLFALLEAYVDLVQAAKVKEFLAKADGRVFDGIQAGCFFVGRKFLLKFARVAEFAKYFHTQLNRFDRLTS
jgi:hypothetical protein